MLSDGIVSFAIPTGDAYDLADRIATELHIYAA